MLWKVGPSRQSALSLLLLLYPSPRDISISKKQKSFTIHLQTKIYMFVT